MANSVTYSCSQWARFFMNAGLTLNIATNYAKIFFYNRIQLNMLMDLSKEHLYDMGIKVMGDVIAILRYSKLYHNKLALEKGSGDALLYGRTSALKTSSFGHLGGSNVGDSTDAKCNMGSGSVFRGSVAPSSVVIPSTIAPTPVAMKSILGGQKAFIIGEAIQITPSVLSAQPLSIRQRSGTIADPVLRGISRQSQQTSLFKRTATNTPFGICSKDEVRKRARQFVAEHNTRQPLVASALVLDQSLISRQISRMMTYPIPRVNNRPQPSPFNRMVTNRPADSSVQNKFQSILQQNAALNIAPLLSVAPAQATARANMSIMNGPPLVKIIGATPVIRNQCFK